MKKEDEQKEALIWSYRGLGLTPPSGRRDHNYEKLKEELALYLDQLILSDFNKLIAILYRIDIPQEKAKRALAEKASNETAGETMAQLIINRQLQKIKTRRMYKQS